MDFQMYLDSIDAKTNLIRNTGPACAGNLPFSRGEKAHSCASCRVFGQNGTLYFHYMDESGNTIKAKRFMPDIVNVSKPNDKTVFVEFADGTKEVAYTRDGDTFNMETGVAICISKKVFSDSPAIEVSGSSAYNKLIKYAMTKVDAKKKAREEEKRKVKEAKAAIHEDELLAKKTENKKREERISEMAEAFKRAIEEHAQQTSDEVKTSLEKLVEELEKSVREETIVKE